MIAYVDTSALVKLVLAERESEALRTALGDADLVVSAVVRTEMRRAALRHPTSGVVERVNEILATLHLVAVLDDVLDLAGRLAPPSLRSLDALHVATALTLADRVERFVTYDARMAVAAKGHGFTIDSPGGQ